MLWFLDTLKHSLEAALNRIDFVLQKSRFWQRHSQNDLNAQQTKVLDAGAAHHGGGFQCSLNAKKNTWA